MTQLTAEKDELVSIRSFTSEERKKLEHNALVSLILTLICLIPIPLGIVNSLNQKTPSIESQILSLIAILTGLFCGSIVGWGYIKNKQEIESGHIEIINGKIQNKSGVFSPQMYIIVNGKRFGIDWDNLHSINIGDEVSIEWAPNVKHVFKIKIVRGVT